MLPSLTLLPPLICMKMQLVVMQEASEMKRQMVVADVAKH